MAGESSISQYDGMIERVYVTNAYNEDVPKASRKVVDAIMNSDMIVLGPWLTLYINFAKSGYTQRFVRRL